jgi:hypothetical protein
LEVLLAPEPVDRTVPGDRDEPAGGVLGGAVARPALECDGDGVLKGGLGEVDVAEDADQGCEDAPVLLAEEAGERDPGTSVGRDYASTPTGMTGRTSIDPYFAPGILAAQASASSTDSTSTM